MPQKMSSVIKAVIEAGGDVSVSAKDRPPASLEDIVKTAAAYKRRVIIRDADDKPITVMSNLAKIAPGTVMFEFDRE